MEWTGDVSVGDWLRERIDDPWHGTMHDVVPRGFEAYARILHPVERDRPASGEWPPMPYSAHARQWDDFHAKDPPIDTEAVTWAQVADAFGTTWHPRAQWRSLVAPGLAAGDEHELLDRQGWRYQPPEEGGLRADVLAVVVSVACEHTQTPGVGVTGIWAGWGGLLGFMGEAPARSFLQLGPAKGSELEHHNRMLGAVYRDRFAGPFRKQKWQPGILSKEISIGPQLRLPHREYVLFQGAVDTYADPDWMLQVPWRDHEGERHGFAPSAQSPSLIWPKDRAWVLVSEVDFDSTVVAGSRELVQSLCDAAGVEAVGIAPDSSLAWDADELNR